MVPIRAKRLIYYQKRERKEKPVLGQPQCNKNWALFLPYNVEIITQCETNFKDNIFSKSDTPSCKKKGTPIALCWEALTLPPVF